MKSLLNLLVEIAGFQVGKISLIDDNNYIIDYTK